jgi:hypothetical protein
MGASKADVDQLLAGWSVREDSLSTATTRVLRYTQDVTMIVAFRGDRAIGVAVIDRPGAGVLGIPEPRYRALVQLIGEGPKPNDVLRDAVGIREFGVGDQDW